MATRAPPPDGRPPAYSMVGRVYKSSLRPVVIILGIVTAGWTLLSGIGAFQDISVDKDHGQPKFTTIDIILGTFYVTTCVIELYGIFAATSRKLGLVRVYCWLSIISALLVIGAGFTRTITHFIYKNALIDECTQILQGEDVVYRFGIWGPTVHDTLDQSEARSVCRRGWNHDSWTEVVSLLVEIFLGVFFVVIGFAYYRQLLDPTSPANAARAPSAQHRMQNEGPAPYPEYYNPPYLGYNGSGSMPVPAYAPPAGPPPDFKPPSYSGNGYDTQKKDGDPFSDFDGVSHGKPGESREALV